MTPTTATKKETVISITPPNFKRLQFHIRGISPLVIHKFSEKARKEIQSKHEAGKTSRTKKGNREARDFMAEFNEARHISKDGWDGIPAAGFRMACISACRIVGFKMTLAKLGIFIEADGISEDGTQLVRIYGKAEPHESYVRLESGVVSVCTRPMYKEWSCKLVVRYDADMFTEGDIANLIARVGLQVGIAEGRPDSKNSAGMGWGLFSIEEKK